MAEMLEGKVALVTGGGRGLGRAHAIALARAGVAVVVNDYGGSLYGEAGDDGPAAETVADIKRAGGRSIANRGSVSDWASAERMIAETLTAFGRLDILVNNAGISRPARIDSLIEEDVDLLIGVHLKGTLATSHFAAAYWAAEGPASGRAIINTSSASGLHPNLDGTVYAAVKAATAALTQGHANELAALGVRVNAISPCARTRMVEASPTVLSLMPKGDVFDRHDPDHVSPLVVYLASDQCRFTGRVFGIEGPDIGLYTPWSVDQQISRDGGWTPEAIAAAMEDLPQQSDVRAFFPGGTTAFRAPPGRSLRALGAV